MELKEKIESILSGLSCKTIPMNLPCSYKLQETTECRTCQLGQILDLIEEAKREERIVIWRLLDLCYPKDQIQKIMSKQKDRPELSNFLSAVTKGVAEESITIDDAIDRILAITPDISQK